MTSDKPFASLKNRCAVVTGASSGIGQAIALELARGGADLILHYNRNRNGIEKTAVQVRELGRVAQILQADLSDASQYDRMVNEAFNLHQSLDIWVNNAGVDLLTGEAKDWPYLKKLEKLFEIDVRGTIALSKAVGDRFSDQQKGVILNIGWDQAERGMEGDSGELFAAAKNAIMGFSRSLAVSLAPHVRVNCVAPGWIRTAWGENVGDAWQQRVMQETPLKRWGTPEDIAKLIRFLASEEASYITGQIYNANGGAER